jgi:hypothetical protein
VLASAVSSLFVLVMFGFAALGMRAWRDLLRTEGSPERSRVVAR